MFIDPKWSKIVKLAGKKIFVLTLATKENKNFILLNFYKYFRNISKDINIPFNIQNVVKIESYKVAANSKYSISCQVSKILLIRLVDVKPKPYYRNNNQ